MTLTIRDVLANAAATIGGESPRLDAELLLCSVLNQERVYLFTWPERTLTTEQQQQLEWLVSRRAAGEPVAYIIGHREFWGMNLEVNPSTLIPRPDTETLVEKALSLPLPREAKVLDLGTGTGAIALALAGERPQWQVVAVDVSSQAVTLARRNLERQQFTNLIIEQSDWYSTVSDTRFNLIVSNPPYIAERDVHLSVGDVRHEPCSALVAGEDGLADLKLIIEQGREHLLAEGWLLVEHGFEQGKDVRNLFAEAGYASVDSVHDLGGNERVTLAQLAIEHKAESANE